MDQVSLVIYTQVLTGNFVTMVMLTEAVVQLLSIRCHKNIIGVL